MSRRQKERLGTAGFYLFLIVFGLIFVLPLAWVFKMSIVSKSELYASPPTLFPQSFTITNYQFIFNPDQANFAQNLWNSLVISFLTTIACLVIGSLCAYALARVRFLASAPILSLVLAVGFFPGAAIISALFLEFRRLQIINTYPAMIIPDTLFSLPLTILLLTTYFRQLPLEVEQAAKVDGASTIKIFRSVTLPLSVPGLVTGGLLTFIYAWNEFLFANTFSFTPSVQPSVVAIPNFATTFTVNYGAQAAAAIVVTVPLVLLVLVFQRRIVSGLAAGAVAGQ